MDSIIGFISDLTGEKRGPSKNYRRFNLMTLDNRVVYGWIFCNVSIEETVSGKILMEAASKNLAVAISGKMTKDEHGNETFKISINNKTEKRVDWVPGQTKTSDHIIPSATIRQALESLTPVRLEATIVDLKDHMNFVENEKERIYNVYIIADSSGAAPIIVYDDLINNIKVKETYLFGQIKAKKIHENDIFYTTAISTITKSNNVIQPTLETVEELMDMNFIDIQEITTLFEEITENKAELVCSACKNKLVPIVGKEHLVKCVNCSKYSLAKSDDFNASILIEINNQKQMFYTPKNLLRNFFKQQHQSEDASSDDVCEYFLINGPWQITICSVPITNLTTDKEVSKIYQGTVVNYFPKRKFGFLKRLDDDIQGPTKDVFFHKLQIVDQKHGSSINIGDICQFKIGEGKSGLMATSIKIIQRSKVNLATVKPFKKTKIPQHQQNDKAKLFKDSLLLLFDAATKPNKTY